MATRRAKSADDLRKQTDKIYRAAIDGLVSGRMSAESFNRRLDAARAAEKRYTGNIQKQSKYKRESDVNKKTANATRYSRRVYMTGNAG